MKQSILIIGGGVSGLTAGIYAQLNGFDSTVIERHTIAGGMLTGWNRKGYHIDNCIHWMTGTNPKKYVYKIWQTVGALGPDIHTHTRDAFMRIDAEGQSHHIYKDLSRMKAEMLAIAPQDAQAIDRFIDTIDRLRKMEVFCEPLEQMTIWKLIPYIWRLRKIKRVRDTYIKINLDELKNQFTSPLLREAIDVYLPKQYFALGLFYMYGAFADGNADIPAGGSLKMAQRMQQRYESLGGKVRTSCAAEEILIENGIAVGVRTAKGEEIRADYVVAACDAAVTLEKLLGGKVDVPYFSQRYADSKTYPVFSNFVAYYGCNFVPEMEDTIAFRCKPLHVGANDVTAAIMKNYGNEPSFAPRCRMVIQVLLNQYADDYRYWEDLYLHDREGYKAEKARVAAEVQREIESRYPELKNLEVVETVTPYSFHRYTGAYCGAYMSFINTPIAPKPLEWHQGRVQGVKNLYLAGQWIQPPGGLPNALVTGKFAIQRICKDNKLKFNA